MCGIFVSICDQSTGLGDLTDILRAANAKRGPDANSVYQTSVECPSSTLSLELFVSELRLRGLAPIVQPHQQDGDVFCWNGEVFNGIDISPEDNDGIKLFRELRSLDTPNQICELFGRIEGPCTPNSPYLLLASVSAGLDPRYEFEELSTDDIYCFPFSTFNGCAHGAFNANIISFDRSLAPMGRSPMGYAKISRVNPDLPPEDFQQVKSLDEIPGYLAETVTGFIEHLDRSVMLRVRNIPEASVTDCRAKIAVLFSGGIDSTVLAYFAHKHIPLNESIDLLNVAFENPRKMRIQAEGNSGGIRTKKKGREKRAEKQTTQSPYLVPDRVTGLQELRELNRLCPKRVWNFVEVNVPFKESQASRSSIESLMLPGRTVMDMSLALALYFASRGVGQMRNSPDSDPIPYTSTAQVLLNGLGSDELLGGYGRHRSAFKTGGWQAVIAELQLEIDRIPTRNLGRDDRVISSHGKETRHPFLSLDVVKFLATLPVHFKMDPRLGVGLGDKMLLRLAASKVGLVEAGARKKRAMQFGSHSARMDGEERGDVLLAID